MQDLGGLKSVTKFTGLTAYEIFKKNIESKIRYVDVEKVKVSSMKSSKYMSSLA